jgi:hypothetical protein
MSLYAIWGGSAAIPRSAAVCDSTDSMGPAMQTQLHAYCTHGARLSKDGLHAGFTRRINRIDCLHLRTLTGVIASYMRACTRYRKSVPLCSLAWHISATRIYDDSENALVSALRVQASHSNNRISAIVLHKRPEGSTS